MNLWAELGGPNLPYGRLIQFIKYLPDESALKRVLLGDKAEWSLTDQLLAEVVHTGRLALWAQADPRTRGPAPEPIPTPWERERTATKRAVLDARLAALKQREAERREANGS